MSASQSSSVERRHGGRARALLSGKLCFEDATKTIDCVIRNITPGGAMVETPTPQLVPGRLQLMQVSEGIVWDAEVAWRRGARIGLVLQDRHDLRDTTDKQLRVLRAIWGQMALR
jgi:hypothetical protein